MVRTHIQARKRPQWVSDEVWSQLDPTAGTLSRGQRRRAVMVAAAVVTVLTAGFAVDRSGVVRAHVDYSADSGNSGEASPTSKFFDRQVPVRNTGWTTVRVTGVGKDGPGLRLVRPGDTAGFPKNWAPLPGATAVPFDLHPGQTAIVHVTYQVTDCTAVPSGSFPLTLRVDRPWGTQTIDVSLPLEPASGTADGLVSDTDMIGWQKEMADLACDPRR